MNAIRKALVKTLVTEGLSPKEAYETARSVKGKKTKETLC